MSLYRNYSPEASYQHSQSNFVSQNTLLMPKASQHILGINSGLISPGAPSTSIPATRDLEDVTNSRGRAGVNDDEICASLIMWVCYTEPESLQVLWQQTLC